MNSSPEIQKIVSLIRMMGESLDLKKLLAAIEEAGRDLLECERAFIWLYDEETHEFTSHTVNANRVSADNGIAGLAFSTGRAIYSQDAANDPRFDPGTDRELGLHTADLLTIPLRSAETTVIGVMQLHNTAAGELLESHTKMAEVLGSLAGIAIRRQVLVDQASEMHRLEGELDIARRIMEELLPTGNINARDFEVAGWTLAADFVGGDTFDLHQRGDQLLFMLADAMGHGIGPTLIAAEFRAMLRASAHQQHDLAATARLVNSLLCEDLKEGRFLTACFGFVDLERHRIRYVNAGHGMAYFCRQGKLTRSLESTGIPLGIMADADYEVMEFELESGDLLALLSDGFLEWKNPGGDQYGEERVARFFESQFPGSCRNLIDALYKDVLAFSGGAPQEDDLTALIIRRH
jgi:sigma-B regulation protein RsbU (phosphoserine phosphatase)